MGEVYKSRDTRLERTVAVKILNPSLAADAQFRERFDHEARAISQFDHPHICALHDVGEHAGTAYLVRTPCSCTVSSSMFEAPPVFQPYSPFSAAQ